MTVNLSERHEIKAATRKQQRELLNLARRGEREARIVKVEDGYAIGVHANKGKPWRIVVLNSTTNETAVLTKAAFVTAFKKSPPTRVFYPNKFDQPADA